MAKRLFFFTSCYPCGTGETFIENEIGYLSVVFDSITIVTNDMVSAVTREIPSNCTVVRMPYETSTWQKLLATRFVLTGEFWKELAIVRKRYSRPVSGIIVSTLLVSMSKRHIFSKKITRLITSTSTPTDMVIGYSYWSNDMAIALGKVFHDNTIDRCFCRAHGWDVYFEVNEARYLPLRQYLLKTMTRQYFISSRGYNYYRDLFPELEAKMRVSRLGTRQPGSNTAVTPSARFRMMSCSNVIALKRVNLIVEALSLLGNEKVEWIHFGDGVLFEALARQCEQLLSTRDNISWILKGRVANDAVIQFMASNRIDVFINVSTSEGIPVSIMEAMSFGIPCMATNVGGTSEIVNNLNGELLPVDISAGELALRITRFMNAQEEERQLKRDAATSTWQDGYDAKTNFSVFAHEISSGE